jgi:hypothetical protein
MSEPCPLCGREKIKDRVRRDPPMSNDERDKDLCLHPSHIYGDEMPACERLGVARIAEMTTEVNRISDEASYLLDVLADREAALTRIANGDFDSFAGDPGKWPTTIAALALGWVSDEPGGKLHPPLSPRRTSTPETKGTKDR